MKLNDREIATILAALRAREDKLNGNESDAKGLDDIAAQSGTFEPLTSGEIDDLCTRLNFTNERPAKGAKKLGKLEGLLIEALDIVAVVAHPETGEDPGEHAIDAHKLEARIRPALNKRRRAREGKQS